MPKTRHSADRVNSILNGWIFGQSGQSGFRSKLRQAALRSHHYRCLTVKPRSGDAMASRNTFTARDHPSPVRRSIKMTNFRTLATAMLLGVSALTVVAPANAAAPCRNAQGGFTKCAGGAVALAPRHAVTPAASQRSAAAPARTAPLTRTAIARTAVPARTAATPAHAVAAPRPAGAAAHKTTTAAHPAG